MDKKVRKLAVLFSSFVFKFLKWTALAILLTSIVLVCTIVFDGLSDDVQGSDVAVILGSKVELTGSPSARLAARFNKGVALYKGGATKTLIVSGGTDIEGFDKAVVMRDYLFQMGIPLSQIIVDSPGYNTEETARNGAEIMKSRSFNSVIIDSQYFHIPRTRMALEQYGVKNIHGAHAHSFELRDIYSVAREAVALPIYFQHEKNSKH